MSIFVVVTSTDGAQVVEASEVIESPTSLLFHEGGKKRKKFAKEEVLAWQACQSPTEAIAFIAEKGL